MGFEKYRYKKVSIQEMNKENRLNRRISIQLRKKVPYTIGFGILDPNLKLIP